jgi:uncharacterized protein
MTTDKKLHQLDDLLLSLPPENEPMMTSQFDGFCAGLIVCPDVILPGEWLPLVWGDEITPPFERIEGVQAATDLITGHYNSVAQGLSSPSPSYGPIFDQDFTTDELLWETWVEGFEQAMRLRPDAWQRIVESHDEEAAASVTMMLTLHQIAEGQCELPEDSIDDLTERAPDLIPDIVLNLNAWTKVQAGSGVDAEASPFPFAANTPRAPFQGQKVGRNEPCPCGSGRKYKRCCGAN